MAESGPHLEGGVREAIHDALAEAGRHGVGRVAAHDVHRAADLREPPPRVVRGTHRVHLGLVLRPAREGDPAVDVAEAALDVGKKRVPIKDVQRRARRERFERRVA